MANKKNSRKKKHNGKEKRKRKLHRLKAGVFVAVVPVLVTGVIAAGVAMHDDSVRRQAAEDHFTAAREAYSGHRYDRCLEELKGFRAVMGEDGKYKEMNASCHVALELKKQQDEAAESLKTEQAKEREAEIAKQREMRAVREKADSETRRLRDYKKCVAESEAGDKPLSPSALTSPSGEDCREKFGIGQNRQKDRDIASDQQ